MANSLSILCTFLLVASVAASPVSNASQLTTLSPIVDQSNSTPPFVFNLSQPALPGLVNRLFLQPLVNFNNQLSQALSSVPEQLAQNSQTLGTALIRPIQLGASTTNNVATRLNETLLSLSNGTTSLLERPVALVGQVNTALSGMALNALNYSTTMVGQGVNNMGESISNAGQDVQHLGDNIMKWVDSLEQLRQQLNGINATTTTPSTVDSTQPGASQVNSTANSLV